MVLILSDKEYEQGTDQVVNWLTYYNSDFLKITLDDIIFPSSECQFDIDNHDIIYKGISLTKEINVIWYRRLLRNNVLSGEYITDTNTNFYQLQQELKRENLHLFEYLFLVLQDKKWLPNSSHINLNKLHTLHLAKSSGLNVPQSKVLNAKKDLLLFYDSTANGLITKPISDTSYYKGNDEQMFLSYTTAITSDQIDDYPEHFFPSLFQEKIPSLIELRIFYIDGKFFTQAAQVSGDESGDVDIKQTRLNNTVKYFVYQLPKEVEKNLQVLMERLDINIGSIDIIVTPDNKYYFLEVNPGGQFLFESLNCNFHIEKRIAQWLTANDN